MTANGCASEPVPAVVGRATIGRPGARSGPSYSSSHTGRSLAAHSAIALAASIGEPPPSATTTVPSSPKLRRIVAPSSTVSPDGFGSTWLKTVASMPAAPIVAVTSARTPATSTPGSVTMNARWPPADATASGSWSRAPTPNSTRLRSVISMRRSASPVTTEPSAQDLEDMVDGGIASDRHPAPAAVAVEPALRRLRGRVLEDPHLVEVAVFRIGDRLGHLAHLAAERELLQRTPPAAR